MRECKSLTHKKLYDIKVMNQKKYFMKEFFIEISKNNSDQVLLLESLVRLTTQINRMSSEELIALYQALKMLKHVQPSYLFKKNPVRVNITNTQLIVIEAMRHMASSQKALINRFNNVISNDWINGFQSIIK